MAEVELGYLLHYIAVHNLWPLSFKHSIVLEVCFMYRVSTGPIQIKTACKIWPLLKLDECSLAHVCKIFATACMLGFSLKFPYGKTELLGEKCTRYEHNESMYNRLTYDYFDCQAVSISG